VGYPIGKCSVEVSFKNVIETDSCDDVADPDSYGACGSGSGPESSVADPRCLSRIRIFSIPDPGSRVKKIPDPDPLQRVLSILTQKLFLSSRKYRYDLGCSSRIRIPDPDLEFLPVPDPGVKKAPNPRCRIRNTARKAQKIIIKDIMV
jgi:hypothetical protein